jgi:DNA-binding XRE family transcriptional regulator
MSKFLSEFNEYSQTIDYSQGVMVELTGTLIEVLLLSLTIPLILYLVRRFRSRYIRAQVDFYLFQIFHKITRMLLRMASYDDVFHYEKETGCICGQYGHMVYGNLESIIFALKNIISNGNAFEKEVKKRTLAEFEEFLSISNRCIEEIDRLTAMLTALPKVQLALFEIRILAYPLRDFCEDVVKDLEKQSDQSSSSHYFGFERTIHELIAMIDTIFQKRRKLIDSMMKYQRWSSMARMILYSPYLLIHRVVGIKWCRLKKRPYKDPVAPSHIADMLLEWRSHCDITQEQAAEIWGISLEDYYDYEQNYKRPPMEIWEKVKPVLREAFDSKNPTETPPNQSTHSITGSAGSE